MFANTWGKFFAMRPSVRALLYVFWIYEFVGGMVGIFIQLYLYQKFTDVSLNMLATMVFFTGIMIGFCVPGFAASVWRLNSKHGFLLSFVVMSVSLMYLVRIETLAEAFVAMGLWGLGQGLFWLTVNTFELAETKNHERDFYSSMLNAGAQTFGLLGPACATALIWLGMTLGLGPYALLFTVAPLVYLLGFLCFRYLQDYRPPRVVWADIKHFFTDRTNHVAQFYTIGSGIEGILGIAVVPLATLFILTTALRVGVYETVFALLSAAGVLLLAPYRNDSNRLVIYGLSVTVIAAVTAWLGAELTFVSLVVYTVLNALLSPIKNVSAHVLDLQVMETGRKETDFYATMLLRDFFLWVWRCAGGLAFLWLVQHTETQAVAIQTGLYLLAGALIFRYLTAVVFVKLKA